MRRHDGVACLLVVLGVLTVGIVREIGEGSRALADCDAARERGDAFEAVAAALRAAEAVVPGSPHATAGYERLAEIARDAERRGDETTAASAWRAMRSASLATRALGVSTDNWRTMAEDGLVRVAAQTARATSAIAPTAIVPSEAALRAAFATDDTPSTFRFLALALGALVALAVALRALGALTRIQIERLSSRKIEQSAK